MKRSKSSGRKVVKAPVAKPERKGLSPEDIGRGMEACWGRMRKRNESIASAFELGPTGMVAALQSIEQLADMACHRETPDFPREGQTLSKEDSDALDTHLYDLHAALHLISIVARGWEHMLEAV